MSVLFVPMDGDTALYTCMLLNLGLVLYSFKRHSLVDGMAHLGGTATGYGAYMYKHKDGPTVKGRWWPQHIRTPMKIVSDPRS